jgi:opacity protein-like surface antigen
MNAVKIALLGTAALAAVSVSARADDLSDLKAQIEALNGRISQLESTPSVPAGYQLLSVSSTDAIIIPGLNSEKDKFYGNKATNIGVMPTADVPASTNIQWSGFVRAGVLSSTGKTRTDDVLIATGVVQPVAIVPQNKGKRLDVVARAGIKVVGTTDTAVGEVGVRIALLAKSEGFTNRSHPSVGTDGVWGWWKITPELTLGGGVDGSLANSSNAFDNRCTCAYINTGGAFGHDDPTQIRLSYASGPISFAVAVEDEANRTLKVGDPLDTEISKKSALGVAGEMKYSGDAIGFDLNAGYWDSVQNTNPKLSDSAWTVNAGANMALGDIANLGVAIGVGEDKHLAGNFDRYAKASVFMGFTLSDALTAELGGAYTDYKGNSKAYTVGGGLYYTPVSQLTLGLEASYSKDKNVAVNETATNVHLRTETATNVDVIAVWRF